MKGPDWEQVWYANHPLALPLIPFSLLFCGAVRLRRYLYQKALLRSHRPPVPVIVAGNISVGGTGKTPLVIWLVQQLKAAGMNPGVVSRGYGGQAKQWPQRVEADSDPRLVGDEPVLIARRGGCPVAVAPQRIDAVNFLLEQADCDIIISDDGLQHYALARDMEIALLDGVRGYGNRYCLPAGPLREPVSRLQEVDFIITKGASAPGETVMQYKMHDAVGVTDAKQVQSLWQLRGQRLHVLAGIGNPDPFFQTLRAQGLDIIPHRFPDHHAYSAQEIHFPDNLPVLMTEKDAVKCTRIASERHWYVPVEAILPTPFATDILKRLAELRQNFSK